MTMTAHDANAAKSSLAFAQTFKTPFLPLAFSSHRAAQRADCGSTWDSNTR
jgi:hypothetical protein